MQAKDKVILDVGCGFGLTSIILASLGAKKVYGIDVSQDAISGCRKLITKFLHMDNVRFDVGDGTRLAYPDMFFDAVVANDIISHIANLDNFFSETKRVLKKSGVFYIYESNNVFNILHKLFLRKYWRMVEEGPIGPNIELPKPFQEIRIDMIREKFSSLDEKTLEYLSRRTKGMWGDEIFKAVEEYLSKGVIAKKRGFLYIDPRNGMLAEIEYNPFKIKRLLGEYGFLTKIIPPYFYYTYPYLSHPLSENSFGQIIKVLIKRALRFFYPFSLLTTPQFEILARKENEV
jgi:ubiquinone/menaquinone biosynthesis C-methylase UbiE